MDTYTHIYIHTHQSHDTIYRGVRVLNLVQSPKPFHSPSALWEVNYASEEGRSPQVSFQPQTLREGRELLYPCFQRNKN